MLVTIKQARLLANLTQEEMAHKMGVNVDTYRRIEKDPEKSSIANAKKICDIVGLSIEDIFFGQQSTLSRL